mmetsp:Transcript_31433/g.74143  ORF Transcript_31433/g.74143 Transcript_31433/m.74143 type:complete len:312 (-) Transcript_31433:862-1797(-)
MTSSILRIILTTWVARSSCCFFPCRVSITRCCFMSLVPICLQSTPSHGFFSSTCFCFTAPRASMPDIPLFSASAIGMVSSASAKERMAYWSMPVTVLADSMMARLHEISAAPPPYTMRLSRTRLRTMQRPSWMERLISSMIILFAPRTKIVTALLFWHSSTKSMRSLVVPNDTSRTRPALPSFSGVSSEKRGTMRAPVAIASSSISTPPTHRTAGSSFCMSRWFASSSKPHWQIARFAPQSLICLTMSTKYCCSCFASASYFSTVSMAMLCLVLGLGGSKGQVRMHNFASLMSFNMPGCEMSLSSTIPYTS